MFSTFQYQPLFDLNGLAEAAKQGKRHYCRCGALGLICGDEHDTLHAWLSWGRSAVFGIHVAAIAKGEIAEA